MLKDNDLIGLRFVSDGNQDYHYKIHHFTDDRIYYVPIHNHDGIENENTQSDYIQDFHKNIKYGNFTYFENDYKIRERKYKIERLNKWI